MNFKLFLQHFLPQKFLTRIVRCATRITWVPWKNWLIRRIVKSYDVNLDEALTVDLAAYPHFNAFFTRALKPGARPADPDPAAVLCPADGRISQAGSIRDGRILQAKGHDYSVAEFLADDARAEHYREGSFVTVYLSPRDYHRVHMPLDGRLIETVHVPGRLFSVAPFAVLGVPRLFARNERLVCHFEGPSGPFVVAMVGAMLVSGVETVWSGEEIPPYARRITHRDWRKDNIQLPRHAEMARFNMGSTAVVLVPAGTTFNGELAPHQAVRMGQKIGTIDHASGVQATKPADL